jgi:lipoprotein-anchoring transpeptidase ErfK/SrfK
MRVKHLLPTALLLVTASTPGFALKTPIHPATRAASHTKPAQHASIRNAAAHKSLHAAAAAHHEAAIAPRHEAAVPPHHEAAVEAMPSERATAIQAALIQHGYLTGEPTGTWDAQTTAAMEKLQSDNGWQTRLTPDARALIKLGLGPNSTPQP